MTRAKLTKGRQKLEMKKIENERDLVVTFTKRKTGALKKASELATLTGAEVALLCFSPTGKPYSFAHPSIDSVTEHFLNPNSSTAESRCEKLATDAHRNARACEIHKQYNELAAQFEAARAEGKRIEEARKGKDTSGWWTVFPETISEEKMTQVNGNYTDLYGRLIGQLTENAYRSPFSYGVALPYAGTSVQKLMPPSTFYPMTGNLGVGGGEAETLVSDFLMTDAIGGQNGGESGDPLSFN